MKNTLAKSIQLRGVRVNNLKGVDLDIPHGQWLGICGVSGSGKSSLAFDTLFAEGQRRYVESFSSSARQFLAQIERPNADSIGGIPPAVSVRNNRVRFSNRATLGTISETLEYLRLLFARASEIVCPRCDIPVRRFSTELISKQIELVPAGAKFQIGFPLTAVIPEYRELKSLSLCTSVRQRLKAIGFSRVVLAELTRSTAELPTEIGGGELESADVVVDRLVTGQVQTQRLFDSLESAYRFGDSECVVFVSGNHLAIWPHAKIRELDGQIWTVQRFFRGLKCSSCGASFPDPDPRLFSFNDPIGACRACEGFGLESVYDEQKIVPDLNKSLRGGAILPWNSPAYAHELKELLSLEKSGLIRVDVPFAKLSAAETDLIWNGSPEHDFGGLRGFFDWLEKRKYKLHLRVFANRFRSYRECSACHGNRLAPLALSYRINGLNIVEFSRMECRDAISFLDAWQLDPATKAPANLIRAQLRARLGTLGDVGLGHVSLDRPMNTLSRGERQRAVLTANLSSTLVDMLYVIDEASIGLHPADISVMAAAIEKLHRRGNTVVMIEHVADLLLRAQRVVELGPESAHHGGEIVFDGSPLELQSSAKTLTAQHLRGERGIAPLTTSRQIGKRRLSLLGATGTYLDKIDVDFPLGCLCVVAGVSGSGKSTLVERTLYPALSQKLGQSCEAPLAFRELIGWEQLDQAFWIDQSPLPRTGRSNPATYVKAYDEIRRIFAESPDAQAKNLTPASFSFNVDGGRCPKCHGQGYVTIDMQFLADVHMKCDECHGRRFRPTVLQIKYRGKSISEILEMPISEAFGFFRGKRKLQKSLKILIDVGLEYLHLGQAAATMSAGESQRLKLAAQLNVKSKRRCLYAVDQPCAGLHPNDVTRLVDCFQGLIGVGHSIIVIEHRLQLMLFADWIIELGPGAGANGGKVIAQGTPNDLAANPQSITGRFLKPALNAKSS